MQVKLFFYQLTCSFSMSSALVGSSISNNLGFRANARAIAIRCRWPPEIRAPNIPIDVSYPCV